MIVVIVNLSVKLKNWYPLGRTTYVGNIIESITSHAVRIYKKSDGKLK